MITIHGTSRMDGFYGKIRFFAEKVYFITPAIKTIRRLGFG
jgi:hypothetical protein